MKKAFIFDLDGTIVDSVGAIATCANDCLMEAGLPTHPVKDYMYFAGDGQYELIKSALRACGDENLLYYNEVMENYIRKFKDRCHVGCKAYDGMEETLWQLKARGMKLAVLSNKAHINTVKVIEEVYGKKLFDIVLGQKDEIPRKPDPAGAFLILEELGITAQEAVYVGDTSVDMKTGKSAGMFTVGVSWGFRKRQELEEHHADVIIDEAKELLNFC